MGTISKDMAQEIETIGDMYVQREKERAVRVAQSAKGDVGMLVRDLERLAACLEDALARGVELACVAHHLAGIDMVRANANAALASLTDSGTAATIGQQDGGK